MSVDQQQLDRCERRLAMLKAFTRLLSMDLQEARHTGQLDAGAVKESLRRIHEECLLLACDLNLTDVLPLRMAGV